MVRVWIFVTVVSLLVLVFGFYLGARLGLFLSLLTTVTFHLIVFYFGERPLLNNFSTQRVEGQDPMGLAEKLRTLSGIMLLNEKPQLFLIHHPSPLVFSVGGIWTDPAIAISDGLLERLDPPEQTAVLAQQLGQLKILNRFTLTFSTLLANAIVGLGSFLDRRFGSKNFFLRLFSLIGWVPLRFFFSRRMYFEADHYAAELTRDPKALASTLWKMESLSLARPYVTPNCSHHLFMMDPNGTSLRPWMVNLHPPINQRIRRLIGQYPF